MIFSALMMNNNTPCVCGYDYLAVILATITTASTLFGSIVHILPSSAVL